MYEADFAHIKLSLFGFASPTLGGSGTQRGVQSAFVKAEAETDAT